MRFLKNGCNEGDRKFLLEMGGSQDGGGDEVGGWLNDRGWKILKSLYIVGRRLLTPPFYEDPPIAIPLPFFKFCPTPLPSSHFPVTSNPHSHCSFCCPISLAEWVIWPVSLAEWVIWPISLAEWVITPFDVLFYLMIIWIYIFQVLIP